MGKIRILGVAPYKGMLNLMKQIADRRTDIEMRAILGNLETGAKAAAAIADDYDIIISRANTAKIISQKVSCPVVDMGMSYYDLLCVIRQALESGRHFAILGFPRLADTAKALCELMQYDIEIFPLTVSEDIPALLHTIKEKGYDTIICDTVPYSFAKMLGITPLLMTSGIECISNAVNDAVEIIQKNSAQKREMQILKNMLNIRRNFTVAIDTGGNVISCLNKTPDYELIIDRLNETLPSLNSAGGSFFINIKHVLYNVYYSFSSDDSPYYVFDISPSEIPVSYSKHGFAILNKEQAEESFSNSFFSNTSSSASLLKSIDNMNRANENIMITGEIGTGKNRLASLLYAKSSLNNHPFYTINCSQIDERIWKFLMSHYNSPFAANGNTIYLSNINTLSEDKQKKLLSFCLDTQLHRRNRVIFSVFHQYGEPIPHVAIHFTNVLECLSLSIPSLRDIIDELPSSASIYLSSLNQELSKQVVGFDAEAMVLLCQYSWPLNRTQFKRVLREAVLCTDTPYIQASVIGNLLEKEKNNFANILPAFNRVSEIDFDRPLSDINTDIVREVLKRNNGNQTRTAKQLAISRTTLWRYLQKPE